MFYIAICDDEQMDREQIQKLTQKICESEAIPIKIVCFENAQELFLSIRSGGGDYHLLLLDIIMPEQDGMALARQLRQQEIKTSLIFISNSREMALKGYEVNAQRYLVKPIDESLLREAFGAAF